MKVVGVTGGIGSGKSLICQIFNILNIPVYEADSAAHSLYDKYPELIKRITKEISPDVVDKTGKIIRKKLGEIVFADEKKLQLLNSFVHPLVKFDFTEWLEQHKGFPYIIKEAAIMFESGANEDCHKIITVFSPIDLRITRIRERDHKTKAEIEQIINNQMSEEERMSKADFIIYNDEKQLVIPQVLKIHSTLVK
jgi:dephospho-CoA kinase